MDGYDLYELRMCYLQWSGMGNRLGFEVDTKPTAEWHLAILVDTTTNG